MLQEPPELPNYAESRLKFRLPDDVLAVVDPASDEVVVARTGSRVPPQVLSADAWALLQRFRQPATLAAAIISHTAERGEDALTTLDDAFPVLVALTRSELLVPDGPDAAAPLTPRLSAAERIGPATLTAPIRVLRDSELWHAVLDDGTRAVVKVVDEPAIGPDLVRRESTALRRLDGRRAPRLLWTRPGATGGTLVLSFVDGDPVDLAALDAVGVRVPGPALDLVLATLDAYADAHDRGVLHGDVHPGNVLADRRGRVHLLDFGIADLPGAGLGPAPRASGGEYLDPQMAAALLADEPLPRLDVAGEVYALAALCFRVLTGAAYLDLELERREALAAITTRAPRSFEEVGRRPWPAVERILARALAHDPADRPENVRGFRAELAAAADPPPAPVEPTADLCDVSEYDIGGALWAGADPRQAADTAALLLAAASATGRVDLHDLALLWSVRAGRTPN